MGKIIEKVRKQREVASKKAAQRYADEFWTKVAEMLEAERMKPAYSFVRVPPPDLPPWWKFWA